MVYIPEPEQIEVAREDTSDAVIDFIASDMYRDAFSEIGDAHKLHIDERGSIGDALESVFYGLVPAEQFPNLLREALEQNIDTFDAVLKDINEKIFKSFRATLKEDREEEELRASVPTVPPVAVPTSVESPLKPQPLLLERKMGEQPEVVPVDAFSENEKDPAGEPKQNTVYKRGIDPYREPVE